MKKAAGMLHMITTSLGHCQHFLRVSGANGMRFSIWINSKTSGLSNSNKKRDRKQSNSISGVFCGDWAMVPLGREDVYSWHVKFWEMEPCPLMSPLIYIYIYVCVYIYIYIYKHFQHLFVQFKAFIFPNRQTTDTTRKLQCMKNQRIVSSSKFVC